MVSFTCGNCQDVIKKPKVISHAQQCHSNYFTCVDCMSNFDLYTVKEHTSCVSEADKYQGKYKPVPNKNIINNNNQKDKNNFLQRPPRMRLEDLDDTSSSSSDDEEKNKDSKHKNNKKEKESKVKEQQEQQKEQKKKKRDREEEVEEETIKKSNKKEYSPLLLPSSTLQQKLNDNNNNEKILFPAFELTDKEEIKEVLNGIFSESNNNKNKNNQSMKEKKVVEELLTLYQKRLAKRIRNVLIDQLQQLSLLSATDADGCVTLL